MAKCEDCLHYPVCGYVEYDDAVCNQYMEKEDVVAVIRCGNCQYGKPIDTNKPPYKYYRKDCIMCECEDVVGDEPMVYFPTHYCGFGKRC